MVEQVILSWARARPGLVVWDWVGGSGLLWMGLNDREDMMMCRDELKVTRCSWGNVARGN